MGIISTYPLSRFHCMLSSVLKYASSKHMYCVCELCTTLFECRRTIAGVSCTRIDCCRLTIGELVGSAPQVL